MSFFIFSYYHINLYETFFHVKKDKRIKESDFKILKLNWINANNF